MGNNIIIDGELADMMTGSGSAMGKMFDALDTEKKVEKVMEETDLVAKIEKQFAESGIGNSRRISSFNADIKASVKDGEQSSYIVEDSDRKNMFIQNDSKTLPEPSYTITTGKPTFPKKMYTNISDIPTEMILDTIHADLDCVADKLMLTSNHLFKSVIGKNRMIMTDKGNVFLMYGEQVFDISTVDDIIVFITLLKKILSCKNNYYLYMLLDNIVTKFRALLRMERVSNV